MYTENSRLTLTVCIASALLVVLAVLQVVLQPPLFARLCDVTFWLGSGFAAVTLVRAAGLSRRLAPGIAPAWALLAAGQIAYAAGDIAWGVTVGLRHPPFPSLADAFYLCSYPLFFLGMLRLAGAALSREDRAKMGMDTVMVAAGVLTVSTSLALDPLNSGTATLFAARSITVAYLSLNLALLFPLLHLLRWLREPAGERRVVLLLAAGGLLRCGLDALLGFNVLQGLPPGGGIDDVVWMLSYALIGFAGLAHVDNLRRFPRAAPAEPPEYGRSSWPLQVPVVWATAACAVLLWGGIDSAAAWSSWPLVGVGLLFALALLRQLMVTRENRKLALAEHRELAERRRAEEALRLANERLEERVRERTAAIAEAHAALQRSEDLYRTLAEAAHDMIFIVNRSGIVEYVNRFTAGQFGSTPGEIAGRHVQDLFRGSSGEGLWANLLWVMEDLQPAYFERSVAFPGRERWLGTWLVPLKDGRETARAALGVSRDITDRRLIEEALSESEAKYRSMMDAMDDLIYICSDDYRLEYMNPAMIRRTGRDATGELCHAALHGLTHPCPWCMTEAVQRGYSSKREVTIPHDQRTYSVSNSAVVHADGSVSRMAVLRDISDLKHAEQERRRLQEQVLHTQKLESLGVLAGGIAHDFNNMLTAVLGNVGLALGDLPPDSPARELLTEAEKASLRAADLCRQMLAYSGRGRFEVQPADLSAVVREMQRMLEVSISKKAEFRLRLAEDLPLILADVAQVRQVVMNLVINASEALEEQAGVIVVSTGVARHVGEELRSAWMVDELPDGLYVHLDVEDTGSGMDEATQARIFDPFFSTKFAGRGLGLATVLGIVRGHHGSILLRSQSGGTVFRVFFPVAPADTLPAAAVPAPVPPTWRGKGTVLLADDEESVRNLGRRMLERLGFQVIGAADGAEAVALFRERREDLACVVLDLTMPRLDGREAFRRIRALDPSVPILIASGFSEQDLAERFEGAPPSAFLQKPFQMKDLSIRLQAALGIGGAGTPLP